LTHPWQTHLLRYITQLEGEQSAEVKHRDAFTFAQENYDPMFLLEYRKVPKKDAKNALENAEQLCRHLAWQFLDPRGEDAFAARSRAIRKLAPLDATNVDDQKALVRLFIRSLDVCREHYYALSEESRAAFNERPDVVAISDSLLGVLPWLADVKKFNQLRNDAIAPLAEQAKQRASHEAAKKRMQVIKKLMNEAITNKYVLEYDDAPDKAALRALYVKLAEDGIEEQTGTRLSFDACKGLSDIGQMLYVLKLAKLHHREGRDLFASVKHLLLSAPQLLDIFAQFSKVCGHKFSLPLFEDHSTNTAVVKFASPLATDNKKLPVLPEIGLVLVSGYASLQQAVELWKSEPKVAVLEQAVAQVSLAEESK
jgi:hypothetical protein